MVPIPRQVARSIVSRMNLTDPSPNRQFTPPGCWLDGGTSIAMFDMLPGNPVPAQVMAFGTSTWLYVVQHISPMTQLAPCRLVSGRAVAGLVARQVLRVPSSVVCVT